VLTKFVEFMLNLETAQVCLPPHYNSSESDIKNHRICP